MTSDQETFAEKIAKLLAKAESTTPEEAELLVAKAQELQTKYAIDEEMVRRARGDERKTKVVEKRIVYAGSYRDAKFDIGKVLAMANDCRCIIEKGSKTTTLIVIGFEEDVAIVELLDASLQIQAAAAGLRWAEDGIEDWMGGMQRFKARREFIFAFASGLNTKLKAAKAAGQREAAAAEAERSSVSTDAATDSVALVIRDKKERVDEWVDATHGQLRKVSRRYSSGGVGARAAGHAAGMRANASSNPSVGGVSRELGR